MEYSNPKLPEGINASRENPLKEFALLLAGLALACFALFAILMLGAGWIAGKIPFSLERAAVASLAPVLPDPHPQAEPLQALAMRIVAAMEVADPITVDVHVGDGEEVNAYATLGGQIIVTGAMLHALSSENAVAMVLAHEIGHVVYRHPVRSLGRVAIVWVALAALAGSGSDQLASSVVTQAGGLTLLGFSRAQELEADRFALDAVQRLYGHTGGALELYRGLIAEAAEGPASPPALLRTHPLGADRIEALEGLARGHGWPLTGPLTPLAPALRR